MKARNPMARMVKVMAVKIRPAKKGRRAPYRRIKVVAV